MLTFSWAHFLPSANLPCFLRGFLVVTGHIIVLNRVVTKDWELTEALQDQICNLLSEAKSMRAICSMPDMPSRRTVLRWMSEDEAFAAKCGRAREEQADWLHDDMGDIEERVLAGSLDYQAGRVVLSSKQWRAAKLAPKKYGDRLHTENQQLDRNGKPVDPVVPVLNITIEAKKE